MSPPLAGNIRKLADWPAILADWCQASAASQNQSSLRSRPPSPQKMNAAFSNNPSYTYGNPRSRNDWHLRETTNYYSDESLLDDSTPRPPKALTIGHPFSRSSWYPGCVCLVLFSILEVPICRPRIPFRDHDYLFVTTGIFSWPHGCLYVTTGTYREHKYLFVITGTSLLPKYLFVTPDAFS